MYGKILITLEAGACDRVILEHIKPLAKLCGSAVVLLHVADGWAARQFGPDAVSPEVISDTAYLEQVKQEMEREGIRTTTALAFGEPKVEILKWVAENGCDLIAMGTHGHRFLGDLLLGATASHVQHRVDVPVLLVRSKGKAGGA